MLLGGDLQFFFVPKGPFHLLSEVTKIALLFEAERGAHSARFQPWANVASAFDAGATLELGDEDVLAGEPLDIGA